jgi:HEPN domain-containing protein
MPPEQVRLEDTRAWISKARGDLAKARHAMTAPEPFRDDAVYHSQQAIEKVMKALLTWHDLPFRKAHSLEELGRLCLRVAPELQDLVDAAAPLSEYAWKYRYPGEEEFPTVEETDEALSIAQVTLDAITAVLPDDAAPR